MTWRAATTTSASRAKDVPAFKAVQAVSMFINLFSLRANCTITRQVCNAIARLEGKFFCASMRARIAPSAFADLRLMPGIFTAAASATAPAPCTFRSCAYKSIPVMMSRSPTGTRSRPESSSAETPSTRRPLSAAAKAVAFSSRSLCTSLDWSISRCLCLRRLAAEPCVAGFSEASRVCGICSLLSASSSSSSPNRPSSPKAPDSSSSSP
mmetsp:Transcript_87759/g.152102  ORF Transcript_87759/g.152102 Transcript_87759/m.152102 type:complete len:210 (-) Transcript_87759:22-651(-)